MVDNPTRKILIAGATGYVGGRLLMALEKAGQTVTCLARNPARLQGRLAATTQVVPGDCLDPATLAPALAGVDTAYYLVHSMGSGGDFTDEDRRAAENFATAARTSGVKRIIYLGGLGNPSQGLSSHLASRQEVGAILCDSGVETVEFRASIVIGSGSLSFELVRALVERLPFMICPKWVATLAQPIAIEDLISYLVAAFDLPPGESRVFEIGGPDQVSYGDLMREYARQRGLRRLMVPVPVLTPRLSSLWLGLVTPVYARVGRKLVDSLRNVTVVEDPSALAVFGIRPRSVEEAIRRALANEDREIAATRWSDAVSSATRDRSWAGVRFGNRIVDSREVSVAVPPEVAFAPIVRIGGAAGWYCGNVLWRLRGFLDLLVGGVGMRRGRRDARTVAVGDTIDFWRVEAYEPNRRLRLAAEMKLPGRAWLEFDVRPGDAGSLIRQTAIYDPVGLAGLAYWYVLYPLHAIIFGGMLRAIARRATLFAVRESNSSGVQRSSGSRPTMTARRSSAPIVWIALMISLALSFSAAAVGAALTNASLDGWYPGLTKPTWNPPNWIFGPVWTLLFVMMAVAAWLVWRGVGWRQGAVPLGLYGIQLALNVLWSGVFFALQRPGMALAEMALLWLAILATLVTFLRVSRAAGWLMAPYLAWVSFAAVLNFTLWQLNR